MWNTLYNKLTLSAGSWKAADGDDWFVTLIVAFPVKPTQTSIDYCGEHLDQFHQFLVADSRL